MTREQYYNIFAQFFEYKETYVGIFMNERAITIRDKRRRKKYNFEQHLKRYMSYFQDNFFIVQMSTLYPSEIKNWLTDIEKEIRERVLSYDYK